MQHALGMNEAIILSALEGREECSVAEVAQLLATVDIGRSIDDGSIYIALRRMTERGFVSVRRGKVISADNRPREIGFYAVTPQGSQAVQQFARESSAVQTLSLAPARSK
jgi:DNA-binding PadR family transcriptional regulator